MFKKEVTFTDFDGNQITETHYFHLSKSELIQMELSEEGGLGAKLEEVVKSGNGKQILATFKDMIGRAYGQRDPANPSKFFKSEKLTEEFFESLAFDAIFTQLMTDEHAAAEFVNNLVPKDLIPAKEKQDAQTTMSASVAEKVSGLPNPYDKNGEFIPWAFREPTDRELVSMTRQQLAHVYARRNSDWKPVPPQA
jgi:hypothetical protein